MHRSLDIIEMYVNYVHVHYIYVYYVHDSEMLPKPDIPFLPT